MKSVPKTISTTSQKNILILALWKSKFQHGLKKYSKRAYILKNISKCRLFFAVSLEGLEIAKKDGNNKGMIKSDNLLDAKLISNVLVGKIYKYSKFSKNIPSTVVTVPFKSMLVSHFLWRKLHTLWKENNPFPRPLKFIKSLNYLPDKGSKVSKTQQYNLNDLTFCHQMLFILHCW